MKFARLVHQIDCDNNATQFPHGQRRNHELSDILQIDRQAIAMGKTTFLKRASQSIAGVIRVGHN